jgi:thymidine phosphorylase
MSELPQAMELARSITAVCRRMKTDVVCLITDMSEPRGRAVGNALEVRECIEFLNGNTAEDLETVTIALAAHMIRLGGKAKTLGQGMKMAYEAVSQGRALDAFKKIVRTQGGDPAIVDHPDRLPQAKSISAIRAKQSGYIVRADARLLGAASSVLGAGRLRVTDKVDPAVGLYLHKKTGDAVRVGEVLCDIHWNEKERYDRAVSLVESAFGVERTFGNKPPLIHAVLEG